MGPVRFFGKLKREASMKTFEICIRITKEFDIANLERVIGTLDQIAPECVPDQMRNLAKNSGIDDEVAPAIGPTPLLLDAPEAASLLRISRATFWKWHSSGRVPLPIRLSPRVVRWRKDELEAWVSAGCPTRGRWQSERMKNVRSR